MSEYILCTAIHFDDKKEHLQQPKNIETGFVICGRRHSDCYGTIFIFDEKTTKIPHTQGFITNTDRFVDREEAYKIAFEAKQIKDEKFSDEPTLISEDLYWNEKEKNFK